MSVKHRKRGREIMPAMLSFWCTFHAHCRTLLYLAVDSCVELHDVDQFRRVVLVEFQTDYMWGPLELEIYL